MIRSYSPVRTIGGGQVLNPIPPKHKRLKPETVEGLSRLAEQDPEALIAYHLEAAGYEGLLLSDLKIMTNLTEKRLDSTLQGLLSQRSVLLVDRDNRSYIHQRSFEKLSQEALASLTHYHLTNPLKAGMPREELKSKFPARLNAKLFNLMLNQLIKDGGVLQEEETVRLFTHKVSLQAGQVDLKDKILDVYRHNGLQPPYFKELCKTLDIDPVRAKDLLMLLVSEGRIVKTKEDLYFDNAAIEDLKQRLVVFLREHGEIDTPRFKDMTGASRKFVIPLLEYFDARNVTLRVGDVRKLRGG